MRLSLYSLILTVLVPVSLPLFSFSAHCQPAPLVELSESDLSNGYLYDAWVEFSDKNITTENQRQAIVADLEKSFNSKALARRKSKRTLPGLFDERDFPLAAEYIRLIENAGAEVRVKSRWLNGATIIADKSTINKIQNLAFVKSISKFHKRLPPNQNKSIGREFIWPTDNSAGFYGYSEKQITQLGLDKLHAVGKTGGGIRIAVIDMGFDLTHSAFNDDAHKLKVSAQWDFVENDGSVQPHEGISLESIDHGTLVLSAVASYAPKKLIGTAYDAEFILCNAEEGREEFYLEECWFVAALEYAENNGADIATSSLTLYGGYTQEQLDGETSIMTIGMNIATANGVICLAGSGNAGNDRDPKTSQLIPPGDAYDVITVGAIDARGILTEFSSDGPTNDGRIKPEVLALGQSTATVAIFNRDKYSRASGTSLATPVMAGAVACLLQVHPDWTVQEIREALFATGDIYSVFGKADPSFASGYGIPNVFKASGLK